MILEPSKTAEEIERRLSALNDPELAKLLRAANRDLFSDDDDTESYTSPYAPYWKRRIGLIALTGLLAMSTGFAFSVSRSHQSAGVKPYVPLAAPAARHAKAAHQSASKHKVAVAPHRRTVPATHAAMVVPVRHVQPIIAAPAPNEALIRQTRAQLLHEHALAMQARAEAAHAQRQARLAMEQQAEAKAWARAEALAQARAEARAEALARAQAENAAANDRAQEQLLQNASDPNIKPGAIPPADTGRVSTNPSASGPILMPGPVDTNCTPHRGSLFGAVVGGALLNHVRVGGTNLGGLLRLVNP